MTQMKSKPPKDHSAADTVFNAGNMSGPDDFGKFGDAMIRKLTAEIASRD